MAVVCTVVTVYGWQAPGIELTVLPSEISKDASVEFQATVDPRAIVLPVEEVSKRLIKERTLGSQPSGSGSAVYIDWSLTETQPQATVYQMYVLRPAGGGYGGNAVTVKAFAKGRFASQIRSVTFLLQHGNSTRAGAIQMPVHSIAPDRPVTAVDQPTPCLGVPLPARAAERRLGLRNTLDSISIDFLPGQQPLTRSSDESLLRAEAQIGGAAGGGGQAGTVLPAAEGGLILTSHPNFFSALVQTLKPIKSDACHASISIEFPFQPAFGGSRQIGRSDVGVRFEPEWYVLLPLAALGSALVWSILALAVRRKSKTRRAAGERRNHVRTLTATILVACVTELVALQVFSTQSRFVLFTFDLDPNLSLPALLVGAISALVFARKGTLFLDGVLGNQGN